MSANTIRGERLRFDCAVMKVRSGLRTTALYTRKLVKSRMAGTFISSRAVTRFGFNALPKDAPGVL